MCLHKPVSSVSTQLTALRPHHGLVNHVVSAGPGLPWAGLGTVLWDQPRCSSALPDGERSSERVRNVPKVTEPAGGRARLGSQAVWPESTLVTAMRCDRAASASCCFGTRGAAQHRSGASQGHTASECRAPTSSRPCIRGGGSWNMNASLSGRVIPGVCAQHSAQDTPQWIMG